MVWVGYRCGLGETMGLGEVVRDGLMGLVEKFFRG